MGTNIRPDISKKNPYWIDRHRYYELKHFCLQYSLYKKLYNSLDGYPTKTPVEASSQNTKSDHTPTIVERRLSYYNRIKMIESSASETDEIIGPYILLAATRGLSYEHLRARYDIPCCKEVYYNLYRRFFWLLSEARQ